MVTRRNFLNGSSIGFLFPKCKTNANLFIFWSSCVDREEGGGGGKKEMNERWDPNHLRSEWCWTSAPKKIQQRNVNKNMKYTYAKGHSLWTHMSWPFSQRTELTPFFWTKMSQFDWRTDIFIPYHTIFHFIADYLQLTQFKNVNYDHFCSGSSVHNFIW